MPRQGGHLLKANSRIDQILSEGVPQGVRGNIHELGHRRVFFHQALDARGCQCSPLPLEKGLAFAGMFFIAESQKSVARIFVQWNISSFLTLPLSYDQVAGSIPDCRVLPGVTEYFTGNAGL